MGKMDFDLDKVKQSKFSEAMRQVKKKHFKVKFWNGGQLKQFGTTRHVSSFFSKSPLPTPFLIQYTIYVYHKRVP